MSRTEQIVQDVTPCLPTAVGTVRQPVGAERLEVAEREIKIDPGSLQEAPGGSQDETYVFFAHPRATSATGFKLVVGQPQQRDTDLNIGSFRVLTRAEEVKEVAVEGPLARKAGVNEEVLRGHGQTIPVRVDDELRRRMRANLWDANDYADIAAEQWENGPADTVRDMLIDFSDDGVDFRAEMSRAKAAFIAEERLRFINEERRPPGGVKVVRAHNSFRVAN